MTAGDGFGHERPFKGETNDWITPQWIINAFNSLITDTFFDLDPCMSLTQPWMTARAGYTVKDDGLSKQWSGTVYCNPPYGTNVITWARRMADHGDGIMLIFARLETATWQDVIFPNADGFLFPKRRITFCRPDGSTPNGSAGAPSAFVAFGEASKTALIELAGGAIYGAYFDKPLCTGTPEYDHYKQIEVPK